jgi:WD40 repeat protein
MGALEEHKGSITALSWRGDSRLLASGSEDGQIVIWNVEDGFPMATIAKAHQPKAVPGVFGTPPGGVLGVEFTSDGRLVSVGRDGAIRVWGADGKPRGATQPGSELLTKVAASFDGKLVLAGDYAGQVEVWDGKQVSRLELYSK